MAIKAVLVPFDFRLRDCDNVGRFAQTMSRQMAWLQQNGRPKWKAVGLNYSLKGWEQYDCVCKYVGSGVAGVPAASARSAASENPVLNAIKGLLDD